LKSCCVLQDYYDDDRDKNTKPARPRPRLIILVSDRSCPKTDGLRPHHWMMLLLHLQQPKRNPL